MKVGAFNISKLTNKAKKYFNKANILLNINSKKSQDLYEKCINIIPLTKQSENMRSKLIVNLGVTYIFNFNKNKAINFYKKSLKEYHIPDKDLKYIYNNLGFLEQNINYFNKAIHIDNKYLLPYKDLARTYINLSKKYPSKSINYYKNAIKVYDTLLSKDKSNKVKYEIKICNLSINILSKKNINNSTNSQWISKNVPMYINPIYKTNSKAPNINVIKYIFQFILFSLKFLSSHLRTTPPKELFQYTTLNMLKSICNINKNPNWDQKAPFKLRLYNSDYMNDPLEGKELLNKLISLSKTSNNNLLKRIINNIYYPNEPKHELHTSRVYIASLSNVSPFRDDSMPLWNSYGDNHRGISIGLQIKIKRNKQKNNTKFTISSETNNNEKQSNRLPLNLYTVSYDTNNMPNTLINNLDITYLRNMSTAINEIPTKYTESILQNNHIIHLIKLSLDRIRFLFKAGAFKYEKEYRIMKEEPRFDKTKYDNGDERLYVELNPKHSNITATLMSITFGNKCKSYYWLPIVRKQLGNVKMYKSNIKYR